MTPGLRTFVMVFPILNNSCELLTELNRTDSDLDFTNSGCVTVHVDRTRTKQQLHSGLEGIFGLQVLSYSTPSGAVSALR